jgi:hypothetical protein
MSGRQLRARLAQTTREVQRAPKGLVEMPRFEDVEIAIPGRLTEEEHANVLAGRKPNGKL